MTGELGSVKSKEFYFEKKWGEIRVRGLSCKSVHSFNSRVSFTPGEFRVCTGKRMTTLEAPGLLWLVLHEPIRLVLHEPIRLVLHEPIRCRLAVIAHILRGCFSAVRLSAVFSVCHLQHPCPCTLCILCVILLFSPPSHPGPDLILLIHFFDLPSHSSYPDFTSVENSSSSNFSFPPCKFSKSRLLPGALSNTLKTMHSSLVTFPKSLCFADRSSSDPEDWSSSLFCPALSLTVANTTGWWLKTADIAGKQSNIRITFIGENSTLLTRTMIVRISFHQRKESIQVWGVG